MGLIGNIRELKPRAQAAWGVGSIGSRDDHRYYYYKFS